MWESHRDCPTGFLLFVFQGIELVASYSNACEVGHLFKVRASRIRGLQVLLSVEIRPWEKGLPVEASRFEVIKTLPAPRQWASLQAKPA
jgi:hypothetical protein